MRIDENIYSHSLYKALIVLSEQGNITVMMLFLSVPE